MKLDAGSAWKMVERTSRSLAALILLALLGTQPGVLWAGTNVWTSIGPDGGNFQALAIDQQNPGTIYAGFPGAWLVGTSTLYKSLDGGASWDAAPERQVPCFSAILIQNFAAHDLQTV
jgi:hypothetical protein